MKNIFRTLSLSLAFTVTTLQAAPTQAEALKVVKENVSKYFKDTEGRCFVIQNIQTDSVPVLNKWAEKIIAFYNKAVAVNYNLADSAILSPSNEVLEKLEAEGRQLEYEYLGKVGHHWFKNAVFENLALEEIAEEQSILRCSLEIKRAMALVAPAILAKDAQGEYLPEAYFKLTHNGVVEERLRNNATQYAAIAVDYWFGEAGIEEILSVNGARAESVSGFFKDVWQTGVVRALRYKKENASYGLSWFEGNVSRADSDFDLAVHFENEQGNNPFADLGQHEPSATYLKNAEELLKAGKDYLAAGTAQ